MSGLRLDHPEPIRVSNDKKIEPLARPIIWFSGSQGSGKTSAMQFALRQASKGGRRTLRVSSKNEDMFSWDAGDREGLVFEGGFNRAEHQIDGIVQKWVETEKLHTAIVLPSRSRSDNSQEVRDIARFYNKLIDALLRFGQRDAVISFDEMSYLAEGRIVNSRDEIRVLGWQVLVAADSERAVLNLADPDLDDMVLMRAAGRDLLDVGERLPDRSVFVKGDALVSQGGRFLYCKTGQVGEDRGSVLDPAQTRAMETIAGRMSGGARFSRAELLDVVGKACGHKKIKI